MAFFIFLYSCKYLFQNMQQERYTKAVSYSAASAQHIEETRTVQILKKSVSICYSKQTSYTNNNYTDL